MRGIVSVIVFLITGCCALCQQPPKPYGALPTAAQLKWHEMEMYCLIHYGVDTYTDKEWGFGNESPSLINPSRFNAEQIVGAAKMGGFKGVIVVAKHHDGLCLWPTATTSHSISKSPWKNGKGDMMKEYQNACAKLGMKLGVYCSPWDRNSKDYGTPAYMKTYRNQLRELCTGYGPLFISWQDGAKGGDGYYGGANEKRNIDRSSYYGWDTTFGFIRAMQPSAVIFGDIGPDVRWVGNEEGFAGETSWATYTPEAPEAGRQPANGYVKYWLGVEGTENGKYWMPAECDVPLRPGWFYHPAQDEQVKPIYTLLDLYYKSVGRGANLDLGISPNRDGVLHDNDVKALKEFGSLLKKIFDVNLVKGATFTASNVRGNNNNNFGPRFLADNDRYSYWATDDNVTKADLIITLSRQTTFNVIRLRENIKLGQRVSAFTIDAFENGMWKEISTGSSIGANRLLRLTQNITSNKLRLRITGSNASIALSDLGIFKEPVHLTAPIITRDANGLVDITTDAPVSSIRYTIDNTEPTRTSPVFERPFALQKGGLVKAKSFEAGIKASETSTIRFGLVKKDWTVTTSNGAAGEAAKAVDNNRFSFAIVAGDIVIDMGKPYDISGFHYLPRQDRQSEGIVDKYIFSTSSDGVQWKQVSMGEFSNIISNPIEQEVLLSQTVEARYFKFSPTHIIAGSSATVAELGVYVK